MSNDWLFMPLYARLNFFFVFKLYSAHCSSVNCIDFGKYTTNKLSPSCNFAETPRPYCVSDRFKETIGYSLLTSKSPIDVYTSMWLARSSAFSVLTVEYCKRRIIIIVFSCIKIFWLMRYTFCYWQRVRVVVGAMIFRTRSSVNDVFARWSSACGRATVIFIARYIVFHAQHGDNIIGFR